MRGADITGNFTVIPRVEGGRTVDFDVVYPDSGADRTRLAERGVISARPFPAISPFHSIGDSAGEQQDHV